MRSFKKQEQSNGQSLRNCWTIMIEGKICNDNKTHSIETPEKKYRKYYM